MAQNPTNNNTPEHQGESRQKNPNKFLGYAAGIFVVLLLCVGMYRYGINKAASEMAKFGPFKPGSLAAADGGKKSGPLLGESVASADATGCEGTGVLKDHCKYLVKNQCPKGKKSEWCTDRVVEAYELCRQEGNGEDKSCLSRNSHFGIDLDTNTAANTAAKESKKAAKHAESADKKATVLLEGQGKLHREHEDIADKLGVKLQPFPTRDPNQKKAEAKPQPGTDRDPNEVAVGKKDNSLLDEAKKRAKKGDCAWLRKNHDRLNKKHPDHDWDSAVRQCDDKERGGIVDSNQPRGEKSFINKSADYTVKGVTQGLCLNTLWESGLKVLGLSKKKPAKCKIDPWRAVQGASTTVTTAKIVLPKRYEIKVGLREKPKPAQSSPPKCTTCNMPDQPSPEDAGGAPGSKGGEVPGKTNVWQPVKGDVADLTSDTAQGIVIPHAHDSDTPAIGKGDAPPSKPSGEGRTSTPFQDPTQALNNPGIFQGDAAAGGGIQIKMKADGDGRDEAAPQVKSAEIEIKEVKTKVTVEFPDNNTLGN